MRARNLSSMSAKRRARKRFPSPMQSPLCRLQFNYTSPFIGPPKFADPAPRVLSPRTGCTIIRPAAARLSPHPMPALRLAVLLAPPQAPFRLLLVRGAVSCGGARVVVVGVGPGPVPARRPARAPFPPAPALSVPRPHKRGQCQRPGAGHARHPRSGQTQRRRSRLCQARQCGGAR
jgi:hypothetical protein